MKSKKSVWVVPLLIVGVTVLAIALGGLVYYDSLNPTFSIEDPFDNDEEIADGRVTSEEVEGATYYGPSDWWKKKYEWGADQRRYNFLSEKLKLGEIYETVDAYGGTRKLLYEAKGFDAVEKILQEKFASSSEPLKAHRYHRLVQALSRFGYGDAPEVMLSVLDEWVEAKSDSYFAFLVRGRFYKNYAWYFRGTRFSYEVSDKGWEGFSSNLELSLSDLERAQALNAGDAEPLVALITVSAGLDLGLEVSREHFEAAVALNPLHFDAYYVLLNFSQPKWGGSIAEMDDVVDRAEEVAADFPYLGLVAYYSARYLYGSDDMSRKEWNTIRTDMRWADAYGAQLELIPDDIYVLESFAYWADDVGHYMIASESYDKIGDRYPAGGQSASLYQYHHARVLTLTRAAQMEENFYSEEGLIYAKRALDMEPESYTTNRVYGRTLSAQGKYKEAKPYLLKAHSLSKRSVNPLRELAWLSIRVGEYEEAISYAERALTRSPKPNVAKELKGYIAESKKQL